MAIIPATFLDLGRLRCEEYKFKARSSADTNEAVGRRPCKEQARSIRVTIVNDGIVHFFSLERRAWLCVHGILPRHFVVFFVCITASSYSRPRDYVDVGSGTEQAVTKFSLVVIASEVLLQLVVVVVPGIGLRLSIGLLLLFGCILPRLQYLF